MTIQEAIKELREVCEIGEDGDLATICPSPRGAWIKFRRFVRENVGDFEAEEIKEEDISEAFLRLASDEEKEENDYCEWVITLKPEMPKSPRVWCLLY